MKTVKAVYIRHEDGDGKVTQELRLVIRRAQPCIDQCLLATETSIRANTALFELAVNKHEVLFTAKERYDIVVERFYAAAEPTLRLFSATQGALDLIERWSATVRLGMVDIFIDKLHHKIVVRVWEKARVDTY